MAVKRKSSRRLYKNKDSFVFIFWGSLITIMTRRVSVYTHTNGSSILPKKGVNKKQQ